MRVIAGKARSLNLKSLPGMNTRPTTDRIKETLFNMIAGKIADCAFLDLFSGSGAIGIEAASRGASRVVLIENNKEACEVIKYNLKFTKTEDVSVLIRNDVHRALADLHGKFDIVFMDPPYDTNQEKPVLDALIRYDLIHEDSIVIIEASQNTDFSFCNESGYFIFKEKNYKTNKHMFLRRK